MAQADWEKRLRHNLQVAHHLDTWEGLLDILHRLEWITQDEDDEASCPECGAWRHRGHRIGCELQAALEAAKEEE